MQSPPTNQTLFDLFDLNASSAQPTVPEAGIGFWANREPVHATELYTRRFEALVAEHDVALPMFTLLSWSAPHHPFQPQSREEVTRSHSPRRNPERTPGGTGNGMHV